MGNGLVDLSLTGQGQAEIVVGLHEVGLDGQGVPVMVDGFVEQSPTGQCQAEVVVDIRFVRPDFQRLPVMVDGLVELFSLGKKRQAEVVVGFRVGGPDGQGCPVLSDGLVNLSPAGQGGAEVDVGFGIHGVDFDGPVVMVDGLVTLSPAGQDGAEVGMGHRAMGVFRQGGVPERFAIRVHAALHPGQRRQGGQQRQAESASDGPAAGLPLRPGRGEPHQRGARHDRRRILPVVRDQRVAHEIDVHEPQRSAAAGPRSKRAASPRAGPRSAAAAMPTRTGPPAASPGRYDRKSPASSRQRG